MCCSPLISPCSSPFLFSFNGPYSFRSGPADPFLLHLNHFSFSSFSNQFSFWYIIYTYFVPFFRPLIPLKSFYDPFFLFLYDRFWSHTDHFDQSLIAWFDPLFFWCFATPSDLSLIDPNSSWLLDHLLFGFLSTSDLSNQSRDILICHHSFSLSISDPFSFFSILPWPILISL